MTDHFPGTGNKGILYIAYPHRPISQHSNTIRAALPFGFGGFFVLFLIRIQPIKCVVKFAWLAIKAKLFRLLDEAF